MLLFGGTPSALQACSAEGSIEASIQSALSKESPSTSAGQPASVGHNGEHVPIPLQGGSGGFPSPGPMSGRSFSLPHSVNTLEGEFSLVDMHIPTVTVEKVCLGCVPNPFVLSCDKGTSGSTCRALLCSPLPTLHAERPFSETVSCKVYTYRYCGHPRYHFPRLLPQQRSSFLHHRLLRHQP